MPLKITFDLAKRDRTLRERGLDFADAAEVFAGVKLERPDKRRDYGELRMVTIGYCVTGWSSSAGHRAAMHATSFR